MIHFFLHRKYWGRIKFIIFTGFHGARGFCFESHQSAFLAPLTDKGEDSKLVHRRIWPKVDASIFFFFWRVRATSMTQRRVDKTRVHFWTFSPVSVKPEILESFILRALVTGAWKFGIIDFLTPKFFNLYCRVGRIRPPAKFWAVLVF